MAKRKLELRDIQLEALKILDEFVSLCERNDLNYYISGGTYLGAVRHKGFIPWDDDVDVAMPRKDFNKFLAIAEQELPPDYKINHFSRQRDSMFYVPKIENEQFKMVTRIAQKERIINLWIDVFPLDGLPENGIMRKLHCARLMILRGEYKLAFFDQLVNYKNKDRPWYENAIISLAQRINLSRLFDSYRIMKRLDRVLSKYDFYDSTYVLNFMGSYKLKSILNRPEIYADGASFEFEGRSFNGPKDYDRYLTHIYGDYMKLPPMEQRNWHQTEVYQE